jgi:hypothetical protein
LATVFHGLEHGDAAREPLAYAAKQGRDVLGIHSRGGGISEQRQQQRVVLAPGSRSRRSPVIEATVPTGKKKKKVQTVDVVLVGCEL